MNKKKYTIAFFFSTFLILVLCSFSQEKKLSSGDKAPDFYNEDISGIPYVLSENSGKDILVVFFNPADKFCKFTLNYIEVLFNKYKKKGFEAVAISNMNKDFTKEFSKKCEFTFPIIADEDRVIHQLYGLLGCCGGIVLINKKKNIEFISDTYILQHNIIRQLVEQAVLGDIIYEFPLPKEQATFKLNETVPKYSLWNIDKENRIDLRDISDGILILNIFSSFCSTCRAGGRIKTLIQLDKKLKRENIYASVIAIFSEPFDKESIDELTEQISIPFDTYIGPDFLSNEQKYITDDIFKNDPLTVVVYKEKIIFVEKIGMSEGEIQNKIVELLCSS